MSDRGIEFTNQWIAENIGVEAYDPGADIIDQTVEQFTADAQQAGIPVNEIEEDMGSVRELIAEAFSQRTDDEIQRLSRKDQ